MAVKQLKIGDKAPNFALPDQDKIPRKLADYRGQKLLLYFYPNADTPGCTAQSCEVQSALPDLKKAGATAIGVSPNTTAEQKKFAAKYKLKFPLLADEEHAVAEAYGVWGEKTMFGNKYMGVIRSAFLIDEKGKIAQAWPRITPQKTVPQALKALR